MKRGYTSFAEDDVLFAKITPCMENGKAAIARGLASRQGFGSTEFHVLRAKESVLPEWLYYFVRQERFRREARRSFTGTAGQQRVPDVLHGGRADSGAGAGRTAPHGRYAVVRGKHRPAAARSAEEDRSVDARLHADMFGDAAAQPPADGRWRRWAKC